MNCLGSSYGFSKQRPCSASLDGCARDRNVQSGRSVPTRITCDSAGSNPENLTTIEMLKGVDVQPEKPATHLTTPSKTLSSPPKACSLSHRLCLQSYSGGRRGRPGNPWNGDAGKFPSYSWQGPMWMPNSVICPPLSSDLA